MSKITELASGQLTATDAITVELVEADEIPAVVIVRWPDKPSVIHPRRFPDTAALIARLFAEAATALAGIKAGRKCDRPQIEPTGNGELAAKIRRAIQELS